MKIKIWDALNSEEEFAKEVEVFDPGGQPYNANNIWIRDRVQLFTERQWADNDYADTSEIR